jgi:hypothetical protein
MQSPPPINGSTSTHTASETCLLGGAAAHHLIVAWRPIPQLKALTELFAAGRGARAHRDAVGDAASEGLRAAFIHPGGFMSATDTIEISCDHESSKLLRSWP